MTAELTLRGYIRVVELEVQKLSYGQFGLDDLPDAFDLGAAYEDELPPAIAAKELLVSVGYFRMAQEVAAQATAS